VVLVLAAFFAALLSTSVGAGGGLLLVGLATFMPAGAVIPSHAAIMLFGSFYSWGILRESTDNASIGPFVIGSIIGLVLAVPLLGKLSDNLLSLILATFLLLTTWIKLPQSLAFSGHYTWLCGLISSFLSVFVGAMRPMLLTMFSNMFEDHRVVVATVNACAALQHLGKMAVFLSTGALFLEAWDLIILLIFTTMAGSWCGRYVLVTTGQAKLKTALKLLITGLAIHLVLDAIAWTPWA